MIHPVFFRELTLTEQDRQLKCAEAVARVAHVANAEHSRLMGEHPPKWEELEAVTRQNVIHAVIWAATGGVTPEKLHEEWLNFKVKEGWVFAPGPVNRLEKTHPCLVAWDKLSELQKLKDVLFLKIIQTYSEEVK